jgi:hypothetical protein
VGRAGSWGSADFSTHTGAIHPTLRATFTLLERENHRALMGPYEPQRVTLLVYYNKDTILGPGL